MAYVRATQQVLVVAYQTAQPVRVSAIAVEVLRSATGTTPEERKKYTVITTAGA